MDALSLLNATASAATALGVAFAGYQLWQGHRQSVTDFEDTLATEYRTLAALLPTEALLGGTLLDADHKEALDEFYHYFDLSNGQIFLRQKGRVSKRTFAFWCDGIRAHLARPAFNRAWIDISGRVPNDFKELRQLITEDYRHDPIDWNCHRADQNQPLVGTSKPASLRWEIHNSILGSCKRALARS